VTEFELLQRAGLAAVIGLLIGIERGWQARQVQEGGRVAGIRTFTLIGALGGTAALLPGSTTLGLALLAFALPFGLFEWRKAQRAGSLSATDFIAGIFTFVLGACATRGSMVLAGAAGVVTAAVLAERRLLHVFLQKLKWIELRAALVLLVMTVVLLPVLPDRPIDPWGALNPNRIWLMTVLVGLVCYVGYVAVHFAGARRGLLFAGLMGGIATSTTVTWTFARLARRNPQATPEVLAAILGAWVVSLLRMTALAVIIAPVLLAPLAAPVAIASLVLLGPAVLAYRASGKAGQDGLELDDPLELPLMLRFLAMLVGIMLIAKLFSGGTSGLYALGGTSGLLDVDPITLSMAQLTGTTVTPAVAASTILIAAASNGVAKAVLGAAFGGRRLGLMLSGMAFLAFAAALLVVWLVG
jgi:uncharacterized membrane protein (DUF4010 family)